VGVVTRGTTHPNRLRRVDRWLVATAAAALRAAPDPLVVDLGYGAHPVTTLELADRLRSVRADVEVVGVEIDRERVTAAQPLARPGVTFRHGGFDLAALAGRRPVLIRAMNVLRQYDEGDVAPAWSTLRSQLTDDGLLVEGTCDELGRRATWLALDRSGPRTLTFAARLAGLERPGELAERLPKVLIHRNVPGEPVHALLADWDRAWAAAAPHAAFGPRRRWVVAAEQLAQAWPVERRRARWRLGELTLPWSAVAPGG
jgi:hypothetical protein